MLPKTFSVRSLQRNLNFGLGAGVKLPGVKRIDVTFGKDTCPAKAALSSLYVNELPRLHVANPTISFRTLAEEPTSHLSILLENEKQITINLHELRSSKEMYRRLIDISQPPSDAGTAAPIVE